MNLLPLTLPFLPYYLYVVFSNLFRIREIGTRVQINPIPPPCPRGRTPSSMKLPSPFGLAAGLRKGEGEGEGEGDREGEGEARGGGCVGSGPRRETDQKCRVGGLWA